MKTLVFYIVFGVTMLYIGAYVGPDRLNDTAQHIKTVAVAKAIELTNELKGK